MAILTTIKAIPLAYNKDLQEDKEGFFDAERQTINCLNIMAEMLPSITLKKERMARMLAACAEAEKTYAERFLGRTLTALFEEDGGYTQNYIRVQAEGAKEGGMYEVRLTKYENGGCMSEIVKQI